MLIMIKNNLDKSSLKHLKSRPTCHKAKRALYLIELKRILNGIGIICITLLVLIGCDGGKEMQTIESPCAPGEPDSTDEEICPPCESDTDCWFGSNPCYSTAICVPFGAPFGVNGDACAESDQYEVPPESSCGCLEDSCQEIE
jgi:hypothetical protein